jgi:hypothetical protein
MRPRREEVLLVDAQEATGDHPSPEGDIRQPDAPNRSSRFEGQYPIIQDGVPPTFDVRFARSPTCVRDA